MRQALINELAQPSHRHGSSKARNPRRNAHIRKYGDILKNAVEICIGVHMEF